MRALVNSDHTHERENTKMDPNRERRMRFHRYGPSEPGLYIAQTGQANPCAYEIDRITRNEWKIRIVRPVRALMIADTFSADMRFIRHPFPTLRAAREACEQHLTKARYNARGR